jgi:phage baseplate assembly protein W
MAEEKFKGLPYPVVEHPLGLFRMQTGINTIKSDLLMLLLTNPGERVMLPQFGTPLKNLIFEPNDEFIKDEATTMIAESIEAFEPRVVIEQIEVVNGIEDVGPLLPADDPRTEIEHILGIKIRFFDPEDINAVQELRLEIPL